MLVIEDELLLHALVRALCTVKFGCPADRSVVSEVAGSPLVAEVAHRAYDALIETYRREYKEGEAHRLEQSRHAEQSPLAVAAVHSHIRFAGPSWIAWTHEQKQEFVRILLAPYTAGPELVDEIISQTDGKEGS